MSNLRMPIQYSALERTLNISGEPLQREDISDDVRRTITLLGSCLPSGTRRDTLGVTERQLLYILSLSTFCDYEAKQFCDIARDAGGLDSNQASFLIDRLKQRDREAV